MLHPGIPVTAHDIRVLGCSSRPILVWLVRTSSHTLDCAHLGNRSVWRGPYYGLHVREYLPRGLLLGSRSFCGMLNPLLYNNSNSGAQCKLTSCRLRLVPRCDLRSELCSLWQDRQCMAPSGSGGETPFWHSSPLALCVVPLLFARYGAAIRTHPRFQVRL
jgi:hypothetical protein